MESGGPRGGGEKVGNADEADGAALGSPEVERGPVASRARRWLIANFYLIVVFFIELGIVEVHDGVLVLHWIFGRG